MSKIKLYRAVKLDEPADIFLEQMGIYWTNDWAQAFPYGYKNNINSYYIYTAKVCADCIDDAKTALMAGGEFSHEREVVLKPGSEVEIIRIETVTILPPIRKGPEEYIFNKKIESINVNTNFKTRV